MSETPIRRRHFRAPQGDEAALIDPGLSGLEQRLAKNRQRTADLSKSEARQELIDAATAYTTRYSSPPVGTHHAASTRIVMAGHQPELFHPGVWLKNFVLSRIGGSPDLLAVNLVVDNDIARNASIRIPAGTHAQPHLAEFLIDDPDANIPFEERLVRSQQMVQGFPARLRSVFQPDEWFDRPGRSLMAERLGHHLEKLPNDVPAARLGELLSQARHRLEQSLGLQTLEVPLSHIARGHSFRRFALHLWRDLPRFQEIYNRSLAEYRIVNKIRSTSHPVPELAADDGYLEAPFWIWTSDKPHRRRLFVRPGDESCELTDRDAIQLQWTGWDPDQLTQWEAKGIKIRPRALITTMYARLFLSDLFIHGIGGAKYDEMTDAIIRRFFGIEPPDYLTVTGTVRLPIPRPATTEADVRNTKQRLREIRFHPERFVNDASPAVRESAQKFAEKKQGLLREHQFQFRRATPEQFRALDDLNRQLSALLSEVEIRLRDELKIRERECQVNRLLGSREFSFVLHPADELPAQLRRMASLE